MKPLHKALIKLTNNLPAEYYYRKGETDPARNPVYIGFNRDFGDVCNFLLSKKTVDFTRKVDNMVSSLWNNFENRLPCQVIQVKMLELARHLRCAKEYTIAMCQCYDRMVAKWFSCILRTDFENVEQFVEAFPEQNFDHPASLRALEAIVGRLVCRYDMMFDSDPNLQSPNSLLECLQVLRNFHVMMDSIFLIKDLQHLVFTATTHIFTMCKHLMSLAHHSRLVNHLEFCVFCSESFRDVEWRSTLSFALCQCYYEVGWGEKAEAHARRFLLDLRQCKDSLVEGENSEFLNNLRSATIKMAMVVFRRCVVESRRRPNNLGKTSNKFDDKEVALHRWPRTQTECLLSAMFEGSSAQFLAIMTTLAGTRRRILKTSPISGEDVDVVDVYNELFFAAQEIISGGNMNREIADKLNLKGRMMAGVVRQQQLFELAKQGKNGVCISDVAEFVKLAFNYEQFEIFNVWIHKIIDSLEQSKELIHKRLSYELKILHRVDMITMRNGVDKKNTDQLYIGIEMDLLELADLLLRYAKDYHNDHATDTSMMIDASTMIWIKCRKFIHPNNPEVVHSTKGCIMRIVKLIENNGILYKWVDVMKKMKDVFEACSMENHEPLVVSELCLMLALILEALSCYFPENQCDTGVVHNFKELTDNSVEYLMTSYRVLEDGMVMISSARCFVSIEVDFDLIQTFKECRQECEDGEMMRAEFEELKIKLRDIHTEMLFHFTRIAAKVSHLDTQIDFNKILNRTRLTKAFHNAVRATFLPMDDSTTPAKKKEYLEKAASTLRKMNSEVECPRISSCVCPSPTPPPPVLVGGSDNSLSFVAPSFLPQDQSQVVCYKLFGCPKTQTLKAARVVDDKLPGCGVATSPFNPIFHVTGLTHGQKYVFALGAYDCKGNLIGGKVGPSTPPITVSHPMSIILAWSHLSKIAYDLCCHQVFEESSMKVWHHFMLEPPMIAEEKFQVEDNSRFHFSNYCINPAVLKETSDIQRQMLFKVLIMITEHDRRKMKVKRNLSDAVTSKANQVATLKVCEKSLIPIKLSQLINNPLNCLEAVLHCYEILAPMIFHRIFNEETIAVMSTCLQGLERVSGKVKCLGGSHSAEVISRVTTCLCFYLARFVRSQGDKKKANYFVKLGQKLLSPNYKPNLKAINTNQNARDRSTKREADDDSPNDIFLNNMKAVKAYEEIQRIKDKDPARYLELLVKVCQKGLKEREYDRVLQWCGVMASLFKNRSRSESPQKSDDEGKKSKKKKKEGKVKDKKRKVSPKQSPRTEETNVVVDDVKYYQVAAYKCPDSKPDVDIIMQLKRKGKLELPVIKDSDAEKKRSSKLSKLAASLTKSFVPMYRKRSSCKKLRIIMKGQSEWRTMMNLIKGLVLYNQFLKKHREISVLNQYRMSRILEDHCHIESSSFIFDVDKVKPVKDCKEISAFSKTVISSLAGKKGVDEVKNEGGKDKRKQDEPKGKKKRSDKKDKKEKKKKSPEPTEVSAEEYKDGDIHECLKSIARAIVLSHRYGHWAVLQNACIHLFNIATHLKEMIHNQPPDSPRDDDDDDDGHKLSLTRNEFTRIVIRTMFMAADFLLDMLIVLKRTEGCNSPLHDWLRRLPEHLSHAPRKIDFPRDDGSVVNLKFVEKFVLRSIELLFMKCKWEKVVHLCLKFTALEGGWLADTLGPIMMCSQKRLIERITSNGGRCQPHLEAAISHNDNRPISSADYCGMRLVVHAFPNKGKAKRSLQLSSVPIDVKTTSEEFVYFISQIPYPIRCLRYSRKLLALFLQGLASNQCEMDASNSPVETPILPTEKAKEQLSIDPFPCQWVKVSIEVVLKSYEMTIGLIKSDKKLAYLLPQSLLELASLYLYNGKLKKSECLWLECIDILMRKKNSIHFELKDLIASVNKKTSNNDPNDDDQHVDSVSCLGSHDVAGGLLQFCGIWNCVAGGIAMNHLARYIYVCDVAKQIKCCLKAANFFKALLRTSLLFPTEDCEYSLAHSRHLMDVHFLRGIHIFDDIHQCNPGIFLKALWCTIKTLLRSHYYSLSLPLLTMHEHFVLKTWNDSRSLVVNQMARVQTLLRMNLIADAIDLYLKLFKEIEQTCAFDMPYDNGDEEDDDGRDDGDDDGSRFQCCLKINEEANANIIKKIIASNLSHDAVSTCGHVVSCSLYLLKAEVLIHLSSFISPSTMSEVKVQASVEVPVKKKHKGAAHASKEAETQSPSRTVVDDADVELKNKMLASAEEILKLMTKNIMPEGSSGMAKLLCCISRSEFELFIRANLLTSLIMKQRQQNKLAAMTISNSMKLINVFVQSNSRAKQSEDDFDDNPFDGQLWNNCLLDIVDCLLLDVESCYLIDAKALKKALRDDNKGKTGAGNRQKVCDWLVFYLSAAGCCKEGLEFAECRNDWIMQVQFLFRGVILHAFNGTPLFKTNQLLQEILNMLTCHQNLPEPIRLIKFKVQLHQLDLSILSERQLCSSKKSNTVGNSSEFWLRKAEECKNAEVTLWQDSCRLSDKSKVESTTSSSGNKNPCIRENRNIYQSYHHLLPLVKIRRAHSIAMLSSIQDFQQLERSEFQEQAIEDILVAYDHAKFSGEENPLLLMEILLNMGCILRQVGLNSHHYNITLTASCLLQALRINISHLHKHSISKEVYFELTLLCLSASAHMKAYRDETASKKFVDVAKNLLNTLIQYISSRNEFMNKSAVDDNFYSKVKDSTKSEPPAFVTFDIFASSVLKMLEFYADVNTLKDSDILSGEGLEKSYKKVESLSSLLTWRDLLDYHTSLSRLFSIEQLINTTSEDVYSSDIQINDDDGQPSYQFIPHLTSLPVDLTIFSNMWSTKIKTLNSFLMQNLPDYKNYVNTCLPNTNLWKLLNDVSESMKSSKINNPIECISRKIYCSVERHLAETLNLDEYFNEIQTTDVVTKENKTEIPTLFVTWHNPRFMNLDNQGEQAIVVLYLEIDGEITVPGKLTTTINQLLMAKQCASCYSDEIMKDTTNIPTDDEGNEKSIADETKVYISQEDLLVCYTRPLIDKVLYVLAN